MELRLFHHYSTVTAQALPLSEEACGFNMWTKSIPSIAFEYEHVYSAILGLSAMHLLSLAPGDVPLQAAVYNYLDEAISSQKEEVTSVTTANSPSLFATSMLLACHAKSRAVYLALSDESYRPPLDWFHLHVGLRQVAMETLPLIEDTDIRAYAALSPYLHSTLDPTLPSVNFSDDPFLQIWDEPSLSSERREILSQGIKYLEIVKKRIEAGEKSSWIQRRLAIMPGELPEEFMGLLDEEDPLALAILARLFALMEYAGDSWWLKGTADFEVRGLAGLVSDDWEWSMKWPLEVLDSALVARLDRL